MVTFLETKQSLKVLWFEIVIDCERLKTLLDKYIAD